MRVVCFTAAAAFAEAPLARNSSLYVMEGLCEYEQQRLAHIRRNHEMLVRLGLVDADSKPIFICASSRPPEFGLCELVLACVGVSCVIFLAGREPK